MKFIYLIFFFLVTWTNDIKGQYIINYSIKNGLSSYNLKGLLQDRFGFIWVGTQDGLNRFDGKEFDIYDKLAAPEKRLLHNHVKSMIIKGDSLWVSTANGGINIINTKLNRVVANISPVTTKEMDNWIEHMQFDPSNENLWMGGYNGILEYNLKTGTVKSWKKNPFLKSSEPMVCRQFIFLDDEQIFVNIESFGFAVFNIKTKTFTRLFSFSFFQIPNQGHIIITSMILEDDRILVGSTNGFFVFKTGNGEIKRLFMNEFPEIENIEIKDFSIFNNKIYISSTKGVFIYDKKGRLLEKITKENSLISDEKTSGCLVDRNKNLWITSYSGLHLQNKVDIPFVLKNTFKNAELKDISSLSFCGKDSLLICTWNGLFFFDRNLNTLERIKYHGQPTYGAFFNLFPFGNGEFIASSQTGNLQLRKVNKTYVLIDSSDARVKWPVPKDFIFSSFLKVNGDSWLFGSEFENGIIYYATGITHLFNTSSQPLSISENSVNKIYFSKDSLIWILYDNSIDILNLKQKKIDNVKVGKLPYAPDENVFFDITEADGKMWIATYGAGLLIRNNRTLQWQRITTENGLCNNSIYTVTKQDENYVWISTNIGLSRISTNTLSSSNFFSKDNYLAFAFDERSALIGDSTFFFGGPRGLIAISPDKIVNDTTSPVVYFKTVSFFDKRGKVTVTDIEPGKVEVSYSSPFLEIDLSCINFNSPELNTFYYRLNHNNYWVNLGTNNKIRIPNFAPGNYLFEVRSASKNGIYSAIKSLNIVIDPPWYQTWWFKLFIVVVVAGILYALYRYRINQIKKEHEIRKNIATDLHDDLGSTLNSVKIFTNLAINGVEQANSLQQVRDNLDQATTGLRDMIWVLDDNLDTVDELVTRLKQYAIPVTSASNIETTVEANFDAGKRTLSKDEKRNLFLLCKEVINNSIKYADASVIHINIVPDGKKIKITITDNGKGFDPDKVRKGYGLKNMQYRAAQIKFKVMLLSSRGNGTQVIIQPE